MTGNQENFNKAMNLGHSEAWDQRWNRAAQYYLQAVEEFPDNPTALTSLGMALWEMQDFETALKYYLRACQVSPADPMPFEKCAQIYERLGRLNEATQAALQAGDLYVKGQDVTKAIENWIRVIRFNPGVMAAHSRLAVTYEKLGRRADAVNEYLAVASLFQHSGNQAKAQQTLSYALKLMPESNDVRQAIAKVNSGQPLPLPVRPRGGTGPVLMAQVRQLESPRESDSDTPPPQDPILEARQRALVTLAGILFDQIDDQAQSATAVRKDFSALMSGASAEPAKPSDEALVLSHLAQAVDAQTRGEEEQAAKELERAIELGCTHPAAFYDLGFLRSQSGRVESTLRHLQVAKKHPDYTLAAHLLMAQILHKNNRMAEAAVEYLEALRSADAACAPEEHADEIYQLYEPLIEAQRQQTDAAAIKTTCENIAAQLLEPNWRQLISQVRAQLPDAEDAGQLAPVAEMLLQLQGGQVIESMALIHSLTQQQSYRAAMEEAFYALRYGPTYLPLHIQIAELLLKEEYLQEGIDKLKVIARAYAVRGEAHQAVKLMKRIVQLSPMDTAAREGLIDFYASQNRIDEALEGYIELADNYIRMADLLKARKTYMTALKMAQQSTVSRRWSIEILNAMADIDMQRLDLRQAIRVLEQIRTLKPEDEKTRAQLIDLNLRLDQAPAAMSELDSYIAYLESNGQNSRAIDFLRSMVKEDPERFELRKRLAETLNRVGRMEEAIAELDALGDIYLNKGHTTGAIVAIKTIIDMNPPNAADYRALLARLQSGM